MALGSLEGKWIVFERSGLVLSRGSMSSSLGYPKSSPQGGADGTLPLALLSTSPSSSRKGRRLKMWGAFCGPKNQRIDTGCVITSNVFVGGHFLDLGLLWKDRKRRRCSGSTFWNNWRRRNWATAAAGARFGTSRNAEMRPALQREHDSEGAEARK